jgi:hypothetical protein
MPPRRHVRPGVALIHWPGWLAPAAVLCPPGQVSHIPGFASLGGQPIAPLATFTLRAQPVPHHSSPLSARSPYLTLALAVSSPRCVPASTLGLLLWARAPRLRLYLQTRARPLSEAGASLGPSRIIARLTNGEIAGSFGLPRRARALPLLNALMFQAMRRYVLLLQEHRLTLTVAGTLSRFSLYWRHLTTPADEVYLHPWLMAWVTDVRMP